MCPSRDAVQGLDGFCSAPWVEGVLGMNGDFHTCCRNATCFGNWQTKGLKSCWNSKSFQEFREKITKGEFPDASCESCYNNGTAGSLASELTTALRRWQGEVFQFVGRTIPEIVNIERQFHLRKANTDTARVLDSYSSSLDNLFRDSPRSPVTVRLALSKLHTIGRITQEFLYGNITTPIIAPFRQVQLITHCNARCIQCPGRYTGEIFTRAELDEKYLDQAFSHVEDVIDFFMNGTEFLLYRSSERVAEYLVSQNIKLSLSTNGILLTPSTIRYLIDNQIVHKLNVSIDGASRSTVESIRLNVKYDELLERLAFLFSYATEKAYDFPLSVSFVLMRSNYRELPDLVRLVHDLRKGNKNPTPIILCQALESYDIEGYTHLVAKEHHTLIDQTDLQSVFKEALAESKRAKIPVHLFYSYDLGDFLRKGLPVPPLPTTASR